MKNRYGYLLVFSFAVVVVACKKNNDTTPQTELSKLPPATQTGANTFGALVNGQAFLPANSLPSSTPPYQCNYIYTNGGYYLTIEGVYESSAYAITDITLGTHQLAISEGQTIKLDDYNTLGKAFGVYDLILQDSYYTQSNNGQLTITKFDKTNQIVSGIFFFNALDSKGDTVHITNGRFDMTYTQ